MSKILTFLTLMGASSAGMMWGAFAPAGSSAGCLGSPCSTKAGVGNEVCLCEINGESDCEDRCDLPCCVIK